MSWIDIAIIVIVVLCGLLGILRGYKKSLLSLGAFIVAFVLAFFLSNVIAEALLGVGVIKNFVLGSGNFDGVEISLANIIYQSTVHGESFVVSDFLQTNFFAPITAIIEKSTVVIPFEQGRAMYMAFLMFSSICGVGIFIIVRFLLMIVTAIIKSYIGKKKSIGARLSGFLISAVQGAVMAFVVTIIFTNFGGLTFIPAVYAVENEYESSNAVFATPVYEGAYAVRNSLFLPNEEMYGRIVNLVYKKDSENPDIEHLTGDRLQLYIDIRNLNYDNNPWSINETTHKRDFDSQNADERKASERCFVNVGYDQVIQAILDYNTHAAERVDDLRWDGTIKDAIPLVRDLGTKIDKLVDDIRAYHEDYYAFADEDDPYELETMNGELASKYQNINKQLEEISTFYGHLEGMFGEGPDFEPLIPECKYAGRGYEDKTPPPPEQGDDEGKEGEEGEEGEEAPPKDDEGEEAPPKDDEGEEVPPEQDDGGENV